MNRTIDRLKLIFLGVFAVCCAGVAIYQFGWEIPRKQCEARRDWWDWRTRVCAHPVLLSDITGRTTEDVLAEKAKKAAEAAAAAKSAPAPKTAPAKP